MKKTLLLLVTICLIMACETTESCDGEASIFLNNKTNVTITITSIYGIKTLRSGESYTITVYSPQKVSYKGIAGNQSWGKSINLESCDLKSIDLV